MKVHLAERYSYGMMSSTGRANCALIRQHNFPFEYDPLKDVIHTNDHDRLQMDDWDHFADACEKYIECLGPSINWFQRTDPQKVLEFIAMVMKKDPKDFDGWRVMGTVNRSSGHPVFTLELFKNNSGTKVFSDEKAPNVKDFRKTPKRRVNIAGDTVEDWFN